MLVVSIDLVLWHSRRKSPERGKSKKNKQATAQPGVENHRLSSKKKKKKGSFCYKVTAYIEVDYQGRKKSSLETWKNIRLLEGREQFHSQIVHSRNFTQAYVLLLIHNRSPSLCLQMVGRPYDAIKASRRWPQAKWKFVLAQNLWQPSHRFHWEKDKSSKSIFFSPP